MEAMFVLHLGSLLAIIGVSAAACNSSFEPFAAPQCIGPLDECHPPAHQMDETISSVCDGRLPMIVAIFTLSSPHNHRDSECFSPSDLESRRS